MAKRKKQRSLAELSRARLILGSNNLNRAEQKRLINAGGGGFSASTLKKTVALAKIGARFGKKKKD